jgi:hypothetical protein
MNKSVLKQNSLSAMREPERDDALILVTPEKWPEWDPK